MLYIKIVSLEVFFFSLPIYKDVNEKKKLPKLLLSRKKIQFLKKKEKELKLYLSNNSIKTYIKKSLNKNKINHILSPMGSGKTTYFRSMIENHLSKYPKSKILVMSPYRISRDEYSDLDVDHYYPSQLCVSISENSIVDYFDTLKNNLSIYDLILIDETDFLYVQGNASSGSNLINSEIEYLSMSQAITLLFFAITELKILCISASANKLEIPPKLKRVVNEWYSNSLILTKTFINEIRVPLTSSINIKKAIIIPNWKDIRRSQFVSSMMWHIYNIYPDSKFIFFRTKKWNKTELEDLKKLKALIISRKENLDFEFNKKSNSYELKYINGYKNIKIIGEHDNTELNDDMFIDNDIIAVNSSSSRAVSLIQDYKAVVVIFDEWLNTSSTQIVGRFRNSKLRAIYVDPLNSSPINKLKYLDDFLFENIEFKYKSNFSFIEKGKYKGKYKGKAIGKAIGKAVGKAIGKNISEDTKKKRDFLNEYFSFSYKNSLSIRDNYKLYKLKCIKDDINYFSEKKFRELLNNR